MFEEFREHSIIVYGGHLKDDVDILKSASGGVATALARKVISDGGVVAGVKYTDDFYSAEYTVISDIDDLEMLRGSKLFDFDKGKIFIEIKTILDTKKPVLFFGLPCIIKSLMNFLKKNYDNLITCELICSGQTYRKVHSDYCERLEKRYKSRLIYFTVRHKKDSWLPEYIYAKFKNGKQYLAPLKKTEYGIGFKILKRTGCCKCKIRGNSRVGDIMIGDYWGATEKDPFWNKCGTSVILIHTEKGKRLVEGLNDVVLVKSSFESAVYNNRSVIQEVKIYEERDRILKLFNESDLFKAMNWSHTFRRVRLEYRLDFLIQPLRRVKRSVWRNQQ